MTGRTNRTNSNKLRHGARAIRIVQAFLRTAAVVIALVLCPATNTGAQSLSFNQLSKTAPDFSRLSASSRQIQVTVRWHAYQASGGAAVRPEQAVPANSYTVLARRLVTVRPARERDPQLADDRIVLVARDRSGAIVGWQVMIDPRIIRAEFPDDTGQLAGRILHRADVEFDVAVPANASIAELRVYQPRWTGSEWLLDPLGVITLSGQP